MGNPDCACCRVVEHDWDAISKHNREHNVGVPRDETVGMGYCILGAESATTSVGCSYDRGTAIVNLTREYERRNLQTSSVSEATTVLTYGLNVVADVVPEVEPIIRRFADASCTISVASK